MTSTLRPYLVASRLEILKLVRNPEYVLPMLGFPLMFYTFFGIFMNAHVVVTHGVRANAYLLASYAAYAVVGAALFGFGVTIANERAAGWLTLKRLSPAPLASYFVAKLASALVFSFVIAALLALYAAVAGGVWLPVSETAAIVAVAVLGSLPFCALGLALGVIAPANGAVGIANVIFLPLAFCGGLWIPVQALPDAIARIAPYLPTYHLGQLALVPLGAGIGSVPAHVAALALFGAACLALAAWAWRRDERLERA